MSDIVKMADAAGEFVTGDDGFVCYWPKSGRGGAYTARDLHQLADELDRRNAKWQADLDAYFEGQEKPDDL